MNSYALNHLDCLIDSTTSSFDFDTFIDQVSSNLKDVSDALQFIGDGDHEAILEASFMSMWKIVDEEHEDHVLGCYRFFAYMIITAWDEYSKDVSRALNAFLERYTGEVTPNVEPELINHLNNCLALNL